MGRLQDGEGVRQVAEIFGKDAGAAQALTVAQVSPIVLAELGPRGRE
ncbi:hypothetical protein [Tessaracoccus flavescens]|nr:hypothetical protein [Tessaracoccus flavescens]